MPTETEWKVGTIIRKLREEQKITLEELSFGLCSPTTLSRKENGEREMTVIFFSALFERLGYYPDGFELYVGEKEYRRYEQRRNMKKLERNRKFSEIKDLLQQYKAEWNDEIRMESLEQQFVKSMQGYICLYNNQFQEGLEILEEAILLTVPSWCKEQDIHYVAGERELYIMARIADSYEGMERKSEAYAIRKKICYYLIKRGLDLEEILQLYTGIVCRQVPQMIQTKEIQNALVFIQNAENALARRGRLYHWGEILYLKGQCYQELYKSGACSKLQIIEIYRRSYYAFRLLDNLQMSEYVKQILDEEAPGWEHIKLDKL